MKTADPPEALIALSGQIHLFSQNQSRPALGLAQAAGSNCMISILLSSRSARLGREPKPEDGD